MYAGVDLGATNIRAVVADIDGTVVGQDRQETPRGPNGIAVTEAVLDTLKSACEAAGNAPSALRAVGIASFGPFDLAAGTVENPANLPDRVETIPLTGPVKHLVDSDRVYLHSDTSAGVIGERFHSDRNPDDMVYLTISSGIGLGACVDGHILSGWDENAGEVGHMTLDPNGVMRCGCGKDGHWEAYCSGNNIPRYAAYLQQEASVETDLRLEDPTFSAADIFDHAGDDPLATHLIEQVAHWNAMGVANIVHAYAPLVVFVGGAVAINNPELVLEPIRDRLPDMVLANIPDVQLTTLGDDVVVRGALASAMTRGTGDRARLRR